MNTNYSNDDLNEVENPYKADSSRKFRKIDILIFIVCLALAFVVWCYALFIDDTVIEKDVLLNFVLEGGAYNESLECDTRSITVYGSKSLLSGVSKIDVSVSRTDFAEYGEYVTATVEYPDGVEGEVKQIKVRLVFYEQAADK